MIPRAALLVAGLAALLLPAPALTILGIGLTVVGLVALGAAVLQPGSAAPAVVIAAAALSWLAGPSSGGLRLAALALAVSLVHASAALAAVVPAGARVPAPVLLRWLSGATAAAAAGVAVVVVAEQLGGRAAPVLPTVVVLALLGAGLLAALAVRARGRQP